jgi:hypothetical protein
MAPERDAPRAGTPSDIRCATAAAAIDRLWIEGPDRTIFVAVPAGYRMIEQC